MIDTRLKFTVSRASGRRVEARFCGIGRDGDAFAPIFCELYFVWVTRLGLDWTGVDIS